MIKKIITITLLMFNINIANAITCESDFFLDDGKCYRIGYDAYSGSRGSEKSHRDLFLYQSDIDGSSEIIKQIQALVCDGSDLSFNDILNNSYLVTNKFGSYDPNVNEQIEEVVHDSTAYGTYQTSLRKLIELVQANSEGKFCLKPVDFDGVEGAKHFCEVSSPITIPIDSDSIVRSGAGSLSVDNTCSVELTHSLKVGESISLNNVSEDTFGFASVKCEYKLISSVKIPKLVVIPNPPECDTSTRNWDNFDGNPAPSQVFCTQMCFWGEGLHCKGRPYIKIEVSGVTKSSCYATDISASFTGEPPISYLLDDNLSSSEVALSCDAGRWAVTNSSSFSIINKEEYNDPSKCVKKY